LCHGTTAYTATRRVGCRRTAHYGSLPQDTAIRRASTRCDAVICERIDKPSDVVFYKGDLYVCSQDNDTLRVFRDVSTLTSSDAPDVTLDNAGSGLDNPVGMAIVDDILFVTSRDNDTVRIFNDVATLADGDAPDVVLDNAGSLLEEPLRPYVFENALHVASDAPGNGTVTAFSPADGLSNNQAPNFVLDPSSFLDDPIAATVVGGRLFISNNDEDTFGIVAYEDPGSIASGDLPDIVLDKPVQDGIAEMAGILGSLFYITDDFQAVHCFLNAAKIASGQLPDLILSDVNLTDPQSLVVRERP
jgi:hypothetical protein